MKFVIVIFFIFFNSFHSQNRFRDISNNRIKISKFVFSEILDNNTFNSSLVTRIIFKNNNIKVYSVETYSPHSILNICIIHKKKLHQFKIERKEDIAEISSFLIKNNTSNDVVQDIVNKLKEISLYANLDYLDTKVVYKIDSIDDYYLIYVRFQKKDCKVVSKKNLSYHSPKIKVGNSFNTFELKRVIIPQNYIPKNSKIANYLDFVPDCVKFDEKIEICRERGMDNIYTSNNLIGLCYVKFAYEK
jgi:hypothetical protein